MSTHVLDEYELEEFNKEIRPSVAQAGRGKSLHGWARLSPFNMPDQVSVAVESDGLVTFHFGYPNNEPASDRPIPAGQEIELRLGRFSGKVLEARISNAFPRFRAGSFTFDPKVVDAFAASLPADRQFACRRNAEVVSLILRTMSQRARSLVVEKLRGDSSPDTESASSAER